MPKHSKAVEKAFKEGKITKKQMDKLPTKLLEGIAKKADSKGGVKESRKKMGKQAHKRGRPKAGSMVKVEE